MPTSTLLVALDGSAFAESALTFAEQLATTTQARLVVCRVVPLAILRHVEADLDALDQAEAYVKDVADRLTAKGYTVETRTPWGDPASAILDVAADCNADLILLTTHGRSGLGRWLYGSVADAVMRHSSVPIIVVPPEVLVWPSTGPLRIVVPLDSSKLAETVLGPAEALARTLDAELVLVQVIEYPPYALYSDPSVYLAAYDVGAMQKEAEEYLAHVAETVRRGGTRARPRVEIGRPATLIADVAKAEQAALIAIATHGRSGVARAVLGSVATRTLQQAAMPLMVVRASPAETTQPMEASESVAAH